MGTNQLRDFDRRGGVAQLVEHLICIQGVAGSTPVASTTYFSIIYNNLTHRVSRAVGVSVFAEEAGETRISLVFGDMRTVLSIADFGDVFRNEYQSDL